MTNWHDHCYDRIFDTPGLPTLAQECRQALSLGWLAGIKHVLTCRTLQSHYDNIVIERVRWGARGHGRPTFLLALALKFDERRFAKRLASGQPNMYDGFRFSNMDMSNLTIST